MLTVEKFLCCFGLEKSLIVVCWIDIIACILVSLSWTYIYATLKSNGCTEQMREILKQMEIQDCEAALKVATTVFVIAIILIIFVIILNYLLIRGAKTRNHKLLIPGLIIAPITILGGSLSYILSGNTTLIVTGALTLICGIYFYICLYSLYVRFRDERKNFNNVQYQQP